MEIIVSIMIYGLFAAVPAVIVLEIISLAINPWHGRD